MSHETITVQTLATDGAAAAAFDPIQLIVDPAAALEAARRMEANSRIGLRFFSDFRRVRPLDELSAEELEGDAELIDDSYPGFGAAAFNPEFIRRP